MYSQEERLSSGATSSPYKDTNPIMGREPSLRNLSDPSHLPKVPPPNSIMLGVRVPAHPFRGNTSIQATALVDITMEHNSADKCPSVTAGSPEPALDDEDTSRPGAEWSRKHL